MNSIRIHIRNKTYRPRGLAGPHIAISALDFALEPGEFVSLVGPSGCGKTTLLNILAGLDQHFEGRIDFPPELAHHRLGYVFQEPRLLPWRNVHDNLNLALPPDIAPSRVEEMLQAVGLEGVAERYPEQLSLGMRRRVAIARAFLIEPDLLLMDEPLVSLDAPTARRIRELLLAMWEARPCTVLYVTHDLREAIALSDRILFLTPSPTRLAAEFAVDLPRAERDEAAIEDFRSRLRAASPAMNTLI